MKYLLLTFKEKIFDQCFGIVPDFYFMINDANIFGDDDEWCILTSHTIRYFLRNTAKCSYLVQNYS